MQSNGGQRVCGRCWQQAPPAGLFLCSFCFLQKIKLRIVSTGTPLSPSRVILLGFYTRSPVLRKEYGANTVRSEIEIAVELRWVRDAADLLRVGAERFDERLEQRHREHAVAREIVVIRFQRVERFVPSSITTISMIREAADCA